MAQCRERQEVPILVSAEEAMTASLADPSAVAPSWRGPILSAWRYPAALGVVVVATTVAEVLFRVFDTTRLSMVFLAGVLVSAVWLGTYPAFLAAAAAFLIYDFYLADPRFTLQFASAEDVLVLVVFLAVALLTGGLAGRVRDEAHRAKARADTADSLYRASRELSSTWEEDVIRQRLVGHVARAAKGQAVLWIGGQPWSSAARDAVADQVLRDLVEVSRSRGSEEPIPLATKGWRARPLRAGAPELGAAAWRALDPRAAVGEDLRLISVLVDLGAAAIVRARLGAANSEIQALARTEQLRNALCPRFLMIFARPWRPSSRRPQPCATWGQPWTRRSGATFC